MILNRRFLLVILLCWPFVSVADDAEYNVNTLTETIKSSQTIDEAITNLRDAFATSNDHHNPSGLVSEEQEKKMEDVIKAAQSCDTTKPDDKSDHDDATKPDEDKSNVKDKEKPADERSEEEKKKALEEAQKKYEDAKATEQSKENRTLTALSTAATGIGGMELAMGLSEQKADKEADANMAAYIATMRCSYGDGKQVKAGPDEIELPGGTNSDLMSLRNEYFKLAADLKERKEALGMKPGIESEEIIDKSQTGLYDDESLSIESGAYASLYRAQMLGSEADQAKIDDERKASKNRVIAGGVVAGAGVVGGVVGNSLINGKLGEKLKDAKELNPEEIKEKVEEIKTEVKKESEKKSEKAAPAAASTPVEKPECEDIDNCLETDGYNYRSLNSDYGYKIPYRGCYAPSRPKSKDYTDLKGGTDLGLSNKVDLSNCSGLEPHEWEVNFSYGTVKGTSMCSSTPGTFVGKIEKVTPVPGNPTPGTSREDGKYCWCRATDVPYSNFSTNVWIPLNTDTGSSCYEFGCASGCAIRVQDSDYARKSLFGFYDGE